MPPLRIANLNSINRATIKAAGPRYTPGTDASAPNLQIRSLLDSIEALALSDNYRETLGSLVEALKKAWEQASPSITKSFARKKRTPDRLMGSVSRLGSEKAGTSLGTLRQIRQAANSIQTRLWKHQEKLGDQQRNLERGSDTMSAVESELHHLRNLTSAVSEVVAYVHSPGFKLVDKNRMFIRGEWGTGKTHFLCDVTTKRMGAGLPTLIVLAHRLPSSTKPLDAICQVTGLAAKSITFLKHLDALGKNAGGRALIIVDGINEADRAGWRKGVVSIARQVSQYPHVGLVLSCRSPFERQMLGKHSEQLFTDTVHTGFEEIEFDAQREFFAYYGVPNPHLPLLLPEFSRPLFLKMLCRSFSGKTATAKSRSIRAIASGQKGMTKVFEDFVAKIGEEIEKHFRLPAKTCWRILKGDNISGGSSKVGIAVTMADTVRDYVTLDECVAIVKAWTQWNNKDDVKQLVQRLITDGLLSEDMQWQDGKLRETVRLPYQRFSDHLICRHLLESHLRGTHEQGIRRSFYSNRPLGNIFTLDDWGQTYRKAGLASAIMLEFPDRVKRRLPSEQRELVFYLPKKVRRLSPFVDVFLEGLLWRPKSSFSKQTDRIVASFLDKENNSVRDKTLEALVCLASRPGHPYSAKRIVRYLEGFALAERDLVWTEFLRSAESTSALYRLIDWIEHIGGNVVAHATAQNLVRLSAMSLTTTHRPLRDRATKALVLLGENAPRALFQVTVELLAFDDPYVRERMLAASYGVLMRRWAFAKPALKESAGEFARALYDAMFKLRAPHATKHILTRDYALGIFALARKLNPHCLGRRPLARITPPLPRSVSPIPAASRIRERDCEGAKSAIQMDFENYTVGRLVASRSPYDSAHREYRGVLRQIKWRVLNLGYSKEKFNQIDSWIAQAGFYHSGAENGAKTDRYGKKYSWIAFFEVAGMRADKRNLPYYEEQRRVSDCDIDPSFPEPAPRWRPPLKPFFRRATNYPARWIRKGRTPSYEHILKLQIVDSIQGPWVLLNGFIEEIMPKDNRELFTFVRGLLVDGHNVRKLRSKFRSTDYPGNDAIPDAGTDPYVFAGEVPWSPTFGVHLRTKTGRARRDLREAFESGRRKMVRKRMSALTRWEFREFVRQQSQSAWLQTLAESLNGDGKVSENLNPAVPKFAKFTVYESVPGVPVEIPVRSFGWEGYHSKENQAGSIEYPALALCEALKLRNTGRLVDLVDSCGRPATLCRVFDSDSDFGRSHLIYVRDDLLRAYLNRTNQKIVWLLWGERSMHYTRLQHMRDQLQAVWGRHEHIHRKMVVGRI